MDKYQLVIYLVIAIVQVAALSTQLLRLQDRSLFRHGPVHRWSKSAKVVGLWQKAWGVSLHAAAENARSASSSIACVVQVNDLVGSGSYGCVHLCTFKSPGDDTSREGIGKRSWTLDDLTEKREDDNNNKNYEKEQVRHKMDDGSSSRNTDSNNNKGTTTSTLQELVRRCRYYWRVEQHCFKKLPPHDQIPFYQGTFPNSTSHDWMMLDIITDCQGKRPAPSLLDLMKQSIAEDPFDTDNDDDDDNSGMTAQHRHHLHIMEQALGLDKSAFGTTLDIVMDSLLQVLSFVHSHQIVHRDIKPGNVLVTTRKLVLLDFGSAADLEPVSRGILKTRVGMEDGGRVAISPIYAAPEVFIDLHRAPTAFDVFSAALLFCQLLFHYFDERTDAGFHQQLRETNYNLDDWLRQVLVSKVRPSGLEDATDYLAERPGLWRLLGDMMRRDPETRPVSSEALERFRQIVASDKDGDDDKSELESLLDDGPFFKSVIDSMESCATTDVQVSRPLHFVVSMRRALPLGLVLSEAVTDDPDEEFNNPTDLEKWKRATADASPGQVFIREIIPGGQADELGIFEVGDQLQGVGELPLLSGGFERAVAMVRPIMRR
jgi:serine/threonine protein kinase